MDALYQYEARHFFAGNLRRFHRLVTAIVIVVAVVLMCIPSVSVAGHYFPRGSIGIVVTGAVILFGLFTDFYYATLPIGKIQREIATGHWDLVRLTVAGQDALIMTHYMLTLRRAQRMLFVEQMLRYICVWLIFWNVFATTSYSGVTIIPFALICLPFVLDSHWRMPMLAAVGIACGVNVADYNGGILATIPVIAVTRLAELLIVALAYALTIGVGDLGGMTMFVILPLATWVEFQICERIRNFVLGKILHLSDQEIASVLRDAPREPIHVYLRTLWETGRFRNASSD